jgi:hypothetical protein
MFCHIDIPLRILRKDRTGASQPHFYRGHFANTAATSAVLAGNLLGKTFFGNLFAQYSLTVAMNGYN